MVIAGVLIKKENEEHLKKIGIRDSKLLTPNKRQILFKKIIELSEDYKIIIIPPAEIDAHANLNNLEGEKAAEIINYLSPTQAILDCPSPNLKAWKEFVYNKLENKKIKLIVEHKADYNFIECASASILAKVTRDEEVEKIKKELNTEFGSGYMSDTRTAEFLKNNWDKHNGIFRESWQPYKNHKSAKKQKKLDDF